LAVRVLGANTVSGSTLNQSLRLKIPRKNANHKFRTIISAKFLPVTMFVEKLVSNTNNVFWVASDTKVCGSGTRVVHSVTEFWVQLVGFQASRFNDKVDTA